MHYNVYYAFLLHKVWVIWIKLFYIQGENKPTKCDF